MRSVKLSVIVLIIFTALFGACEADLELPVYTVSYDKNADDATGSMEDSVFTYGTFYNLRANGFSRAGYGFSGWAESPGGPVIYTDRASVKNLIKEGTFTLYAKWNEGQYTVIFNSGGGQPAPGSQYLKYGDLVSEPPAMSRNTFIFDAWYRESSFTIEWDFEKDTVSSDLTLHARWIPVNSTWTVIFETNEGSPVPEPKTIMGGSLIEQPKGIIKEGFIIEGWYTDPEFSAAGKWDFDNDLVSDNMTLYALWVTPGQIWGVRFFENEGIPAPSPNYLLANHGTTITEPPAMTKEGYTFGGWFTEETFIKQWNFNTDTVTRSTDLYAKWIYKQYTVTFNAKGGQPVPPPVSDAGHGETISEPAAMTNGVYSFGGWYREETFENKWDFENDTVSAYLILYAKWGYVVSFNVNSGGPAQEQQIIIPGGTVDEPGEITKTDHSFGGWFTDNGTFAVRWNFETGLINTDTVLYARWDYIINFNADNGNPAPDQQIIIPGGKIQKPQDMLKTNYTFEGWFTNSGFSGTPWNFDTVVTSSMTLYAKWELNKYTVTFNVNGGSPAPVQQTITHGGTASQPTAPTKSNQTFAGWYVNAGFSGNAWNFTGDTVTGNITLNARWTCTLTFYSNGGSGVAAQTVTAGGMVSSPSNPAKAGYTFGGWYTNNTFTTTYSFGTALNSHSGAYAKWNPITYTIAYNANGGSGTAMGSTSFNYGEYKSLAQNTYTRSNYTFMGWAESTDGTIKYLDREGVGNIRTSSGTTNLYAVWYQDTPVSGGPVALSTGLTSVRNNTTAVNVKWIFDVSDSPSLGPQDLSYSGRNIAIELQSSAARTITLNTSGSLFTIGSGVTLILGNNITLVGRPSGTRNNRALVTVSNGGRLIMNSGSTIRTNYTNADVVNGGGVFVAGGGIFVMNNGTISGNDSAFHGGGVYTEPESSLTMNGGTVSSNKAQSTIYSVNAGGIRVGGTFVMSNGTITGNSASIYGGGVYVIADAIFFMNNGTISANTAGLYGGGVYVGSGVFNKTGGTIYGSNGASNANTASSLQGHAVYANGYKRQESTITGSLFFDGTTSPPIYSGSWEY